MLKVRFTKPYHLANKEVGDELILKDHNRVPTHLIPLVEVIESDSDEAELKGKKKKKSEDK